MSGESASDNGGAGGTAGWWWRLLTGLATVFIVFTASALGSDRGQAGLLVAALVLVGLLAAESALFGRALQQRAHPGLRRPAAAGLIAALAVCAAVGVYAALRGAPLAAYPGWPVAAAGPLRAGRDRRGGAIPRLPVRTAAPRPRLLACGNCRRRRRRSCSCISPVCDHALWRWRCARRWLSSCRFRSPTCSSWAATPSGRRRCCTSPRRGRSRWWRCRAIRRCRWWWMRRARRSRSRLLVRRPPSRQTSETQAGARP